VESGREAVRRITAAAVKLDGEVVREDGPVADGEHVVQVGRRLWARVIVGG